MTLAAIFAAGMTCGRRLRDDEVSGLSSKLLESEKTIEIQKNTYAVKTNELNDLLSSTKKLASERYQLIQDLVKQLNASKSEALYLNQLVVKWKKAYEGAVAASQTEVPPVEDGKPVRQRVDFTGTLGTWLNISGHTLTDPPYAYIHASQVRPLRLGIAVVRTKDGKWATEVITDDRDEVTVEIEMSGIDLGPTKPSFRQRLWFDAGAYFLNGSFGTMGVSYRGDRYSLGASCTFDDSTACGVTFGARIFK